MNVFVVSKGNPEENSHPTWQELRRLGHSVEIDDPASLKSDKSTAQGYAPDVIISMGITIMEQTLAAIRRWPGAKLYCYNWDVYEWVWTNPRREETPGTPGWLDYKAYGYLLHQAKEVWVPSDCTGRRTKQWYGLDNWVRVLSSCPWWEHDNVRDDGYALCCLREIPDPWWGMFERCCTELGIPYRMTKHGLSEEEYRDAVAGCRFICAPLYELSTGGLSLMEAHYHGKPVLLSDSEWNGGRDYMGDRAWYFKHEDIDDFKEKLVFMQDGPGAIRWRTDDGPPGEGTREWIRKNFSEERMATDMHRRITA